MPASHAFDLDEPVAEAGQPVDPFPVRQYIGAMAAELALMARSSGDHALAELLASASRMAER